MAKWILEPGHTAAEFCARHMMVTYVRGFVATTTINRLDFGVRWNALLEKDGLVVGNTVEITIDAEAILEES